MGEFFLSEKSDFLWPGFIPKNWDKFTKMGTVIKGTRLLPMKTPLDEEIFNQSEYTEPFDIDEVLEQDVGLVICLVKHAR